MIDISDSRWIGSWQRRCEDLACLANERARNSYDRRTVEGIILRRHDRKDERPVPGAIGKTYVHHLRSEMLCWQERAKEMRNFCRALSVPEDAIAKAMTAHDPNAPIIDSEDLQELARLLVQKLAKKKRYRG